MSDNWSRHFERCRSNPDLLFDAIKIFKNNGLESQIKRTHVYFVRSGNLVKIGKSADIRTRIKNLGYYRPEGITILGIIPFANEKQVHRDLKHLSVGGEWFFHCSEIFDYLYYHDALTEEDFHKKERLWKRNEIR